MRRACQAPDVRLTHNAARNAAHSRSSAGRAALCGLVSAALAAACTGGSDRDDNRRADPPAEAEAPNNTPGAPLAPDDTGSPPVHLDRMFARIEGVPLRTNAAELTLAVGGDTITAYRFKYGARGIDCHVPDGYSDEIAATTAVVIDQRPLADGPYVVCLIGKKADGTWQAMEDATAAVWTLDRTPPAAVTINPLSNESSSGITTLSWSEGETEQLAGYDVALAPEQYGCDTAVHTYKTTAASLRLPASLPGGRFLVCVFTTDELGNRAPATNNGAVVLDRPVTLHTAFFRGDLPESRALFHATRAAAGAPWTASTVAKGSSSELLSGRLGLQLGSQGQPLITYLRSVQRDLLPRQTTLALARASGAGTFTSTPLATASGATDLPGSLAILSGDVAILTHLAQSASGNQLLLTRGDAPSAAATPVATSERSTFADSALAVDDAGAMHMAYASAGQLFYRTGTGNTWQDPVTVDTAGCAEVLHTTLAQAGGRLYIAYACTAVAGTGASCKAGIATTAGGGDRGDDADRDGGDDSRFTNTIIGTIDNSESCLPFTSARPTLAVDSRGRAHVAFRSTSGDGLWSITYLSNAGSAAQPDSALQFGTPVNLPDPDTATGYPQLALDASDRLYLLYINAQGLRLASGTDATQLQTEPVAFSAEPGSGPMLELADLATAGGHGRSFMPAAIWGPAP